MRCKSVLTCSALVASLGLAQAASAHPGHGSAGGFGWGVLHPLTGLDHILAMLAVGLYAAQVGGRAVWALPLTFVSLMVGGGLLRAGGVHVPAVEQGIMASVLILGLLLATAVKLPTPAIVGLVGLFAVFHGYAHVNEIDGHAFGGYAAGFVLATVALHAAGVALGWTARSLSAATLLRYAGGAIAACGALMFAGVI